MMDIERNYFVYPYTKMRQLFLNDDNQKKALKTQILHQKECIA